MSQDERTPEIVETTKVAGSNLRRAVESYDLAQSRFCDARMTYMRRRDAMGMVDLGRAEEERDLARAALYAYIDEAESQARMRLHRAAAECTPVVIPPMGEGLIAHTESTPPGEATE